MRAAHKPLGYAAAGGITTAAGIALAVFLAKQGLDNASKIAGIISLFVDVVSLVIGVWSARRQQETPQIPPAPNPGSPSTRLTAGR